MKCRQRCAGFRSPHLTQRINPFRYPSPTESPQILQKSYQDPAKKTHKNPRMPPKNPAKRTLPKPVRPPQHKGRPDTPRLTPPVRGETSGYGKICNILFQTASPAWLCGISVCSVFVLRVRGAVFPLVSLSLVNCGC